MKPVRAFAGLMLLVALWIGWRLPGLRDEYEALTRPAEAVAPVVVAASDAPPAQPSVEVAEATVLPLPAPQFVPKTARIERAVPASNDQLSIEAPSSSSPPVAIASAGVARALGEEPAAAGYRLLAEGKRREAAEAFRQALGNDPSDSRAETWRAQLASLEKRWSGSAYIFLRDSGGGALAASPVLGGGQSGAQIAYTIDPLARRPVEIVARVTAPNAQIRDGAQTAIGLSWRLRPGMAVTVERLAGIGDAARSAWTVRAAGGAATTAKGRRWLDASAYGEAGAVGVRRTATYAAVQARAGLAADIGHGLLAAGGAGLWASVQRDRTSVSRAEIGPTARVRAGPIEASADYRFRVAGNASPGSGPAVTLAAYF